MRSLFSDFFRPGGKWSLSRCSGFFAMNTYTFAFLWALLWLGKVPDWSSLGMGYAGVMGGAGILMGINSIAGVVRQAEKPTAAVSPTGGG